jgi:hypothetical protein
MQLHDTTHIDETKYDLGARSPLPLPCHLIRSFARGICHVARVRPNPTTRAPVSLSPWHMRRRTMVHATLRTRWLDNERLLVTRVPFGPASRYRVRHALCANTSYMCYDRVTVSCDLVRLYSLCSRLVSGIYVDINNYAQWIENDAGYPGNVADSPKKKNIQFKCPGQGNCDLRLFGSLDIRSSEQSWMLLFPRNREMLAKANDTHLKVVCMIYARYGAFKLYNLTLWFFLLHPIFSCNHAVRNNRGRTN